MTAGPVLEYEGKPPRWKRWVRGLVSAGTVVVSHGVAAGVCAAVLIGGLAALGVIGRICTIFTTPPPGGDGPGALEAGVGAIILGLTGALVGIVLTVAVVVIGVVVDAIRRPLRAPWWLALVIMVAVLPLAALAVCIVVYHPIRAAVLPSILWGLGLSVLFCLYWIPLGCSEAILRLARRTIEKFIAHRQNRRPTPSARATP